MKIDTNEIEVNGVAYVPKSSIKVQAPGVIRIVILQRGWVMVGYYSQTSSKIQLRQASVVRQFGTTKGLGEIATNGPTSSTKLDPCNGLVEFHELTEVASITCEESKWASKLV